MSDVMFNAGEAPRLVAVEPPSFPFAVERVLDRIQKVLIQKNRAYGNSALDPVRVFSRATTDEQLLVRIDDKLSRIAKGRDDLDDEDVIEDLIGYLVMLLISRENEAVKAA